MKKLAVPMLYGPSAGAGSTSEREDGGPCEHCLCASCEKLCMKCTLSCSPMHSRHIPLIGCPEYVNMRELKPLRYTYRGGADVEYKLHLSS